MRMKTALTIVVPLVILGPLSLAMQDAPRKQGGGKQRKSPQDGTVTDASWKAKSVFRGPIGGDTANPTVRTEELPERWFAVDFDDSAWSNATEYAQDRIDPKQPYFEHDFKGAKWIWTADLDLDNTVILRKKVEKPDATRRWTTKPDLDASCAPAVR